MDFSAESAGLSEMVVLPRAAVTSLTASETFSTVVDMVDIDGWWLGKLKVILRCGWELSTFAECD